MHQGWKQVNITGLYDALTQVVIQVRPRSEPLIGSVLHQRERRKADEKKKKVKQEEKVK